MVKNAYQLESQKRAGDSLHDAAQLGCAGVCGRFGVAYNVELKPLKGSNATSTLKENSHFFIKAVRISFEPKSRLDL